jgi:hypothetical protein
MGKIPVKVKLGVPDNFGRGINSIPDFIIQSGPKPKLAVGRAHPAMKPRCRAGWERDMPKAPASQKLRPQRSFPTGTDAS